MKWNAICVIALPQRSTLALRRCKRTLLQGLLAYKMNGELVQSYLEHTAKLHPQKTAITDGRSSMTFEELSVASDRLAKSLVSVGVSCDDRVVYYLQRSFDCIVATLGILKAGATYIPLDQKTPLERWRQILID